MASKTNQVNMAVEIKSQNITILVQQQFGIGFQKIENKAL